ncbi:MAG: PD40 domain-containing protein [Gammaproteobacteria bacterium]|nr:PD40 domain-containing protein [Gammaproteobacteria bacterium]
MNAVHLACRTAIVFAPFLLMASAMAQTDAVSGASPAAPAADRSRELPVVRIPDIPPAAEAYYAPDGLHLIAQVRDPDAQQSGDKRIGSALTYIFTEDGKTIRRINHRGQDACSFFFPDQKRVIWTSTRDNMDMPLGSWSDPRNYPPGAELYTSDLYGNDVVRLTRNQWYDAEVTVSPNGKWIVWTRQIDGHASLWRMRADGSDEQQVTFTDDWQPGAPFYLADNDTIIFQAWRESDYGKVEPTPMTVFTIKADGTGLEQRTFDRDMTWGPGPAADGRHYIFTRIIDRNNHELFLGDLGGDAPLRLTYNPGFDGMKSFSKDSSKMVFVRLAGEDRALYSHVMDLSSLKLGPENYRGIPKTPVPANAVLVTDFTVARPIAAP